MDAGHPLHVSGFHRLFEGDEPPIWTTGMPAVNGTISADGLACLYGAPANGGSDGDATLLSPATTRALGGVQLRSADAVLGLRMGWRLGYHQAFGAGRPRRSVTTATAAPGPGLIRRWACRSG